MKKLLFALISIYFIQQPSFARVPLEQCFDLYHNTKEEYKDISPVWAEIMLQSGHLKGIRFFGDFGSIEHPNFKPHPAFNIEADTLKLNAPQDAISALLEYLFPSPNGQVLAINQRQNDPLGQLSKKDNLILVNKLIETIYTYKTNPDSLKQILLDELTHTYREEIKQLINNETKKRLTKFTKANPGPKIQKDAYATMSADEKAAFANQNLQYEKQIKNEKKRINQEVQEEFYIALDKKNKQSKQDIDQKSNQETLKDLITIYIEKTRSSNERSKKTQKIFDPIRDHFVDILVKAVLFEDQPALQQKYPPNLIINTLFGFALTSADHIDEIYHNFKWIFVDHPQSRAFSKENYEALVAEISKDPKFEHGVNIDHLICALLGNAFYEQILPAPLTYVNTFYMHQNKRIPYPNCGETSLLNFFYYLWGDRGIINPSYIEATEQKLNNKNDENWIKLKAYFLEFSTIYASASRDAQEKWSNLISNMNKDDTDPSLKIIYRQNVCNIQGIGLINMLNVLEKIIPDQILSQPFTDNELEVLELASTKLDRLAYLFSRPETLVNWSINGEKKVTHKITEINFSFNEEKRFKWDFKDESFLLEPIKDINNDWRKNCAWEKTPLLIKAWVRSDIQSLNYTIEHPCELYALNLLSLQTAGIAIDKILTHEWIHMKSLVPQIIGKTLFTNDRYARAIIYTLLHANKGVINKTYYPELDWQTYIPDYKPMSQRATLQMATFMNYWHVVQNYSIEDNINAQTHIIATESGCLPIVKWILDQKPEAIQDKDPGNRDLIQITIEEGHFDVLDYLLTILKEPLNYKTENKQTLLHLYAQSSHDMTSYIEDLLQKGMKLDVVDNQQSTALHNIYHHSHFNNMKFLIDKMVEAGLTLDHRNIQNETPLINSTRNAHSKAFFYLLDKGASLELKGWNHENLLHIIAGAKNKLDIIDFLVEQKQFDIHQPDNQGNTPLHYAAEHGSISHIQYLLEKGAKTDVQNKAGQTPLHVLLGGRYNNIDGLLTSTKLLLDNGNDLNTPDANGSTPFATAFRKTDMSVDLIRGLMKLGGNFPDFSQKTDDLLHNACESGQLDLVKFLVEELMHPIDGKDKQGQSPLHIAILYLNPKIVDYLLSQNADLLAIDNKGQTPLHMLSEPKKAISWSTNCYDLNEEFDDEEALSGPEEEQSLDSNKRKILILKSLLKHGSQINETDAAGKTILLLSIPNIHASGIEEFIDILIENGADPLAEDNEGNNALHCVFNPYSIHYYNPNNSYDPKSYLEQLLAKNLDLESKNNKGETPLFYAMTKLSFDSRYIQKLQALLDLGANINTTDNNKRTILDIMPPYILTKPEAPVFINLLIEHGLNQKTCDNFFASKFQQCLTSKICDNTTNKWFLSLEPIKYFISKGASLHQKDESNQSIFARSIFSLSPDNLTALFTETGLDINSPDEEGNTFLHQLAQSNNFNHYKQEIIIKMIELGADINAQNLKGETPFLMSLKIHKHYFLQNKILEFIMNLKNRGLNLKILDADNNTSFSVFIDNFNCLHDDNINATDYFLNNGFSVNQTDNNGNTILHKIIKTNHQNALDYVQKYVEQYGADVTIPDKNGKQALAYVQNDAILARYLIEKGADSNIVWCGQTWKERLGL